MSETTVETRQPSGGNVFTRKIGMLPMWGWMAILLVLVVLYALYKKSKSGSTAGSGAGTSASTAGGTVNSPGGVDASLVPQFINQTYDNSTPPPAPNITTNVTVPTPPVTPPAVPSTPPQTISGAPGSYTANLPGGMNEWTSTGKYSLNTIAKSHGMTAQQLIASSTAAENNPSLKAYVSKGNYNAMLPAGVQVFIPNQYWQKGLQKT